MVKINIVGPPDDTYKILGCGIKKKRRRILTQSLNWSTIVDLCYFFFNKPWVSLTMCQSRWANSC